jgi:ankyrin repeat protein
LPDGVALLAATQMRQIEIVRFVLKSGVRPTLESFQYAAEHEFFELCHLFVEFGSREILSTPELERQLNEAINKDRRKTAIKLINQGVDFTTQDNHAIRMASELGRIAVVRLLLKHGVDFTTDDNYAIKLASEWGHTEVVRLLLENDSEYKVDPKAEDNYAIRLASEGGHLEVVRLLLKHGADPTVNPAANDNYAIKNAFGHDKDKIIALLEEYGARR